MDRLRRLRRTLVPFNQMDFYLECPIAGQVVSAWLDVEGWVVSRNGRTASIAIAVDGRLCREIRPDIRRPDVEAAFPDRPHRAPCGFRSRIARSEFPSRDSMVVRVTATPDTLAGRLLNRPVSIDVPVSIHPTAVPPHSRSQARAAWDASATTLSAAQIAVCGTDDVAEALRSGAATADDVVSVAGIRDTDVVLEIGCGIGRVGAHLAPRCKRWIGTDVSTNMLAHAEANLKDHANVELRLLNGYDLAGIPSDSIDVVYCTGVFMHLDEWDRYRYIEEAHRVLKSGGRLYVDNYTLLAEEGWQIFQRVAQIDPVSRPAHVSKSSTPQELETYAQRAGFTDIRVRVGSLWVTVGAVKP